MKIDIKPERSAKTVCKSALEVMMIPAVVMLGLGLEIIKSIREKITKLLT